MSYYHDVMLQRFPPNERWKPCIRYPGWEASNIGRVRYDGQIVIPSFSRNGRNGGYLEVTRHRCGPSTLSRRCNIRVHELVADAWVGERKPWEIVDHIDRDIHNNFANNLRYVRADADHNRSSWRRAKFTDAELLKICRMLESGDYRQYEIADKFDTTTRTIRNITNARGYRKQVLKVFKRVPVPVWRAPQ